LQPYKNNGDLLFYIKEALGCSNITTTKDYFGSYDEDSLFCGLELFKSLPGEIEETARVEKKMLFINALPAEFKTDDTITLINKFNISERTISRWLKEFVEAGFLERVKPGFFRKTTMATMAMAMIAD
jgi:hypothetical protein